MNAALGNLDGWLYPHPCHVDGLDVQRYPEWQPAEENVGKEHGDQQVWMQMPGEEHFWEADHQRNPMPTLGRFAVD